MKVAELAVISGHGIPGNLARDELGGVHLSCGACCMQPGHVSIG